MRLFLQNIFGALNLLSSKELIGLIPPLAKNIFRLSLAESKKGYTFVPVFERQQHRLVAGTDGRTQAVFEARQ